MLHYVRRNGLRLRQIQRRAGGHASQTVTFPIANNRVTKFTTCRAEAFQKLCMQKGLLMSLDLQSNYGESWRFSEMLQLICGTLLELLWRDG